jgi:COMPASS component SWD3
VTNVLLSAGCDNTIILWDIRTNKAIFKILAHPEPITSIDISFDSTLISTSSYDGFVRLWDMVKGNCLKTMAPESGSTYAISMCKMTPNSKYLLMANMNSKMGLYNFDNEQLKIYSGHKNTEYSIEALFIPHPSTNRMTLLSGSEDGKINGWNSNS